LIFSAPTSTEFEVNESMTRFKVWTKSIGVLLGRSLFPLLTCLILGGVVVWGPWVTFGLAVVCFAFVSVFA
jgi:hypothetical protein